jgi:hypothetical protein
MALRCALCLGACWHVRVRLQSSRLECKSIPYRQTPVHVCWVKQTECNRCRLQGPELHAQKLGVLMMGL